MRTFAGASSKNFPALPNKQMRNTKRQGETQNFFIYILTRVGALKRFSEGFHQAKRAEGLHGFLPTVRTHSPKNRARQDGISRFSKLPTLFFCKAKLRLGLSSSGGKVRPTFCSVGECGCDLGEMCSECWKTIEMSF